MEIELREIIDELTKVIDAIRRREFPDGVTPATALDANGRPLLVDLLTAKANALAALAHLQ